MAHSQSLEMRPSRSIVHTIAMTILLSKKKKKKSQETCKNTKRTITLKKKKKKNRKGNLQFTLSCLHPLRNSLRI